MSYDFKLEERFHEPEGWQWHEFTRGGQPLRFGVVMPPSGKPTAHVICLPGVSEFGEKYFELAQTCLGWNLAFWVIDWMGQGRSGRYFKKSQKRHSFGFRSDILDLHAMIQKYVLGPDTPRAPLIMMAHSTGGNIGLRYLQDYPRVFSKAAFTAPLWGLKVFEKIPKPLMLCATAIADTLFGHLYAFGQGDWDLDNRPETGPEALSHDPIRVKIHSFWFEHDPRLVCGGVTYGWLRQAVLSCRALSSPKALARIKIPCLIGLAGEDTLVDNTKIIEIVGILPNARLKAYPASRHEILMESNDIRNGFLNEFYMLMSENMNYNSGA